MGLSCWAVAASMARNARPAKSVMVMPESGKLPPEKPEFDIRWQNPRRWHDVPEERADRTKYAIEQQCLQARMPGYKGYIPSVRARSMYMRTPAELGKAAALEQANLGQNSGGATEANHGASSPALAGSKASFPDDHPLGKSRAPIIRSYSVPTIPGYSGYVPAKYPENIHGGGILQTCKLANRAIAERLPPLDPHDPRTAADLARTGLSDHRGEREKVADVTRAHCARPIPGYGGFVPRVNSESICAARFSQINAIAADFCDDRVLGESHQHHHSAPPQVPKQRQLRL